jgi:hypothetical protein
MHLLHTQLTALFKYLGHQGLEERLLTFSTDNSESTDLLYSGLRDAIFTIQGHGLFTVTFSPGEDRAQTSANGLKFDHLYSQLERWAKSIHRELKSINGEGAGSAPPAWLAGALPSRVSELERQRERIDAELRRFFEMGRLIWQTGDPLCQAAVGALKDIGVEAEETAPMSTYDITATLNDQSRLLLEVTGIEGGVPKNSKKINQVLQTKQEFAQPGDRVVLAVNPYRMRPPGERTGDILTAEAAGILRGLDVPVISTPDLFAVWVLSLSDQAAASALIRSIHTAAPGLFSLRP